MTRRQAIRAALVDAGVDIATADATAAELDKDTSTMTDRNRRELTAQLRTMLEEAAHPDTFLTAAEIRAAGIPARFAADVAMQSRELTDPAEAADIAAEVADRIVADLDRFDEMTPTELVAKTLPQPY